uniref:Opsin 8, group member a n=1 Tax=Cyprinus carpio TaxID=7962 RepID=A0A8C1YT63_CYPCA
MDRYISKLSPAADYGAGTFLLVVAILSILGNAAVLVTATWRHSVLKASELLTVNLAVTDIGMALSMCPLSVASAFNHIWIGGNHSCLYYGLMGMIFSVASIMTLAAMGLVRYLVTGNPSKSGILHKAYQSIQSNDNLPNSGAVERKVTLMGILISAGFIVSWAPYVFISLWTVFHSDGKGSVAPIVSLLPCLFAKCSTVYNPFVYYVFHKSFRRELRQIWICCCRGAVSKMTFCRGAEPSEEQKREETEE